VAASVRRGGPTAREKANTTGKKTASDNAMLTTPRMTFAASSVSNTGRRGRPEGWRPGAAQIAPGIDRASTPSPNRSLLRCSSGRRGWCVGARTNLAALPSSRTHRYQTPAQPRSSAPAGHSSLVGRRLVTVPRGVSRNVHRTLALRSGSSEAPSRERGLPPGIRVPATGPGLGAAARQLQYADSRLLGTAPWPTVTPACGYA